MAQTILVVEDDSSLNRNLREVLGARWAVAGALTAAEARTTLHDGHFDLVLLDLCLPDGDGLSLLGELEQDGLVQRAIVITGHGDRTSAIEALRLRTLDFLIKPIGPRDLERAVDRALRADPVVLAPLSVLLSRARRFLRGGKVRDADVELRAARMRYPESPEIVNLLGVAAELHRDLTSAVDLYVLADRIRPYSPARKNAQRLAFRSWKQLGAIEYGDDA